MQLTDNFWSMAERFVDRIHRETGLSTIVCDEGGIIRKAYDRSRIGKPHAGAQKILTTSTTEVAVTKEDALRNPLVKEGLNCAILIDGAKVATFGIGGELHIVRPVAKTAALVLADWIKQLRQRDLVHETAGDVSRDIGTLSAKIEEATGNFDRVGEAIRQATRNAADSVNRTDKILDTVQRITQQTYLLSINAGIEAGRLGDQGRVFASVAEEMGRLAQSTREAMDTVQKTIEEIRSAVASVSSASQQSQALFAENTATMSEIARVVKLLLGSIKTLEDSFRLDTH